MNTGPAAPPLLPDAPRPAEPVRGTDGGVGGDVPDSRQRFWRDVLGDLQQQMSRATFDSWLKQSRLLHRDGGAYTIELPNRYALEWVENRLHRQIDVVLRERTGEVPRLHFVSREAPASSAHAPTPPAGKRAPPDPPRAPAAATVEAGSSSASARERRQAEAEAAAMPPSEEGPLSVELVTFDPTQRGWVQLGSYAIRFWQPYLGDGPFRTWFTLRSFARNNEAWPSVQLLADITANGNKQKLIGRTMKGEWREGWLERLETERVIWYRREGKKYRFRVLENLPLLTPFQVATLSKRLQGAHKQFLDQCRLDYAGWQALSMPSLVRDLRTDDP